MGDESAAHRLMSSSIREPQLGKLPSALRLDTPPREVTLVRFDFPPGELSWSSHEKNASLWPQVGRRWPRVSRSVTDDGDSICVRKRRLHLAARPRRLLPAKAAKSP